MKKVEAAGFAELILYVNVGQKPHAQVKEEMARFMAEVAPSFAAGSAIAGGLTALPRHLPSRV